MKITVIDGQGGRIGKTVIEQIKAKHKDLELYAIGTNTAATAAMLKAGANFGATGENAALVNVTDADIVIGPVGIVFANALLGEITPAIATAVGASRAFKILIPVNRCNHFIAGCTENPLGKYTGGGGKKLKPIRPYKKNLRELAKRGKTAPPPFFLFPRRNSAKRKTPR